MATAPRSTYEAARAAHTEAWRKAEREDFAARKGIDLDRHGGPRDMADELRRFTACEEHAG